MGCYPYEKGPFSLHHVRTQSGGVCHQNLILPAPGPQASSCRADGRAGVEAWRPVGRLHGQPDRTGRGADGGRRRAPFRRRRGAACGWTGERLGGGGQLDIAPRVSAGLLNTFQSFLLSAFWIRPFLLRYPQLTVFLWPPPN